MRFMDSLEVFIGAQLMLCPLFFGVSFLGG